MTTITDLTEGTRNLFTHLCEDAHNWSGTPLLDMCPENKGHLTHLKKLGLIKTQQDEDNRSCFWCYFTEAGIKLAAEIGQDLTIYYGEAK